MTALKTLPIREKHARELYDKLVGFPNPTLEIMEQFFDKVLLKRQYDCKIVPEGYAGDFQASVWLFEQATKDYLLANPHESLYGIAQSLVRTYLEDAEPDPSLFERFLDTRAYMQVGARSYYGPLRYEGRDVMVGNVAVNDGKVTFQIFELPKQVATAIVQPTSENAP